MQTVVERLDSIAGVDRQEWDRLGPDDVFGSWGWLRTVEETSLRFKPIYFIARANGSLIATAACRRETGRRMDHMLFGRRARLVQRLRLGVSPVLACGSPVGLCEHVHVDPQASPDQRRQWTMLLIDAMEQFAKEQGLTLCFRNVIDGEGTLPQMLAQRGYLHAMEMPTTVMDIRWSSFAEYERDLKQTHPGTAQNIPREKNHARKAGVVFRKLGDEIDEGGRLHAILENHFQRLNGVSYGFGPAFIDTVRRNLGDQVVVHVAEDDQGPIGVTLAMRGGDTVFLSIGGNDQERGRKAHVYFNNSYNVPIEDAIASGARRIYCGKMMYELKERRGFRLVGLSAYLKVPNPIHAALLRPLMAQHRAGMRRKLHAAQSAKRNEAKT